MSGRAVSLRRFLAVMGVAGLSGVARCLGDGADETEKGDSDGEDEEDETDGDESPPLDAEADNA